MEETGGGGNEGDTQTGWGWLGLSLRGRSETLLSTVPTRRESGLDTPLESAPAPFPGGPPNFLGSGPLPLTWLPKGDSGDMQDDSCLHWALSESLQSLVTGRKHP